MIGPQSSRPFWISISESTLGRWAMGGGPAGLAPFYTEAQSKYYKDDFFKLPGGVEPNQEQKNRFKAAWDVLGLVPPGVRLKNSMDKNAAVVIRDSAIEVHLPCELPFSGSDLSAAKARLVVAFSDPAFMDEMKRLRDEVTSDQENANYPSNLKPKNFPWRVVRVETDLYPIETKSNKMPSPGPPPGAGSVPNSPRGP